MAKKKNKVLQVETMSTLAGAKRSLAAPTVTAYSRRPASTTTSPHAPTGTISSSQRPASGTSAPAARPRAAAAATPADDDTELAKARHEVFQLGLEGMSRARRRDVRLQKLIRLGAKPPPRAATNYRQLMVEARQRRDTDRREKETLRRSGLALPNLDNMDQLKKFRRPRNKNKVRGFDGQPGRFKNGVQIVPRRVRRS